MNGKSGITWADLVSLGKECGLELDIAQTMALGKYSAELEKRVIEQCWESINKHIKTGDLGGDGTDKNAERNGLVLATNILHEKLHGPIGQWVCDNSIGYEPGNVSEGHPDYEPMAHK